MSRVTNSSTPVKTTTTIGGIEFVGVDAGNRLNGGVEDDLILGADFIIGVVSGTSSDGAGSDDIIDAASGNDYVIGLAGNDSLLGAAGQDVLAGNAGQDTLLGEGGTTRYSEGRATTFCPGGSGTMC